MKLLNKFKYKILKKLTVDICHRSNCSTCEAGYTWDCLDGQKGSGCYLATFVFNQARKVWGVE